MAISFCGGPLLDKVNELVLFVDRQVAAGLTWTRPKSGSMWGKTRPVAELPIGMITATSSSRVMPSAMTGWIKASDVRM